MFLRSKILQAEQMLGYSIATVFLMLRTGLAKVAFGVGFFLNKPSNDLDAYKRKLKTGIKSCKQGYWKEGLYFLEAAEKIEQSLDIIGLERPLYMALAQIHQNTVDANHHSLKIGLMQFVNPNDAFFEKLPETNKYKYPIKDIFLQVNTRFRNKIINLIEFKKNLPRCTGNMDLSTIIHKAKEAETNKDYLNAAFYYTESVRLDQLRYETYLGRHCALIKARMYNYNHGYDEIFVTWLASNKKDAKRVVFKLNEKLKENNCIENRIALMEFYISFIDWFYFIGEEDGELIKDFKTQAKELFINTNEFLKKDVRAREIYEEYKNAVIVRKPDCFSNEIKNDLWEMKETSQLPVAKQDENYYLTQALKFFNLKAWFEAADSFDRLTPNELMKLDCETLFKFCAVYIDNYKYKNEIKYKQKADNLLRLALLNPSIFDLMSEFFEQVKEFYSAVFECSQSEFVINKSYNSCLDAAYKDETRAHYVDAHQKYTAAIKKDEYRFEAYAGKMYLSKMLNQGSYFYYKGIFLLTIINNNHIKKAIDYLKQRSSTNSNYVRYLIYLECGLDIFYWLIREKREDEAFSLKKDILRYFELNPIKELIYNKDIFDSTLMLSALSGAERIISHFHQTSKLIPEVDILDTDEKKPAKKSPKTTTIPSIVETPSISLATLDLTTTANVFYEEKKPKPNPFLKRKSTKKPNNNKSSDPLPVAIFNSFEPQFHHPDNLSKIKKNEIFDNTPAVRSKKEILNEEKEKKSKEILDNYLRKKEADDIKFTLDNIIQKVVRIDEERRLAIIKSQANYEKEHKQRINHVKEIITGLVSYSIVTSENEALKRLAQAKKEKERAAQIENMRKASLENLKNLNAEINDRKHQGNPYPSKRLEIPGELLLISHLIYELEKQFKIKIYIVGGAIRDLIKGVQLKDCDLVTASSPEDLNKAINKLNLIYQQKFDHCLLKKINKQAELKKRNLSCSRLNALGKEFGKHWIITHNPKLAKGLLFDAMDRDLTQNSLHGSIIFWKNNFYLEVHDSIGLGYCHALVNFIQVIDEERLKEDTIYLLRLIVFLIRFKEKPTDHFLYSSHYYINIVKQIIKMKPQLFQPPIIDEERLKVFASDKFLKLDKKDLEIFKEIELEKIILPGSGSAPVLRL